MTEKTWKVMVALPYQILSLKKQSSPKKLFHSTLFMKRSNSDHTNDSKTKTIRQTDTESSEKPLRFEGSVPYFTLAVLSDSLYSFTAGFWKHKNFFKISKRSIITKKNYKKIHD